MWYVVSKSRNANTFSVEQKQQNNNVNEGLASSLKVVPGGKVARTALSAVEPGGSLEAHWRLVVYEVTDDSGVRGGVETRTTGVQALNARKTNPTLHSSASSGHWGALMKARLQNRRCNPAPPPSPKPDMPEKTRNWPG